MKTAVKPKECGIKECKETFIPHTSFHKFCSPKCLFADMDRIKREEYLTAIQGEGPTKKHDSVSRQHSLTQPVFNKWVREVKEKDATCCISCQRPRGAFTEHASHFKSVGAAGILRYHPDNCNLACEHCNAHLSGNIAEYRKHLVVKIGIERVEFLESECHKTKRWKIAELKDLRSKLNKEIRDVKKT